MLGLPAIEPTIELFAAARCKARVLQPVEDLIGIDIIAPGNLADGNTRKSCLSTDDPLLGGPREQ